MMRACLVMILLLAGCAQGYRDPAVAMRSMAVFDPVQYQGRWYEVAAFPEAGRKACARPQADYRMVSPGVMSVESVCMRGGTAEVAQEKAVLTGPGRYRIGTGAEELWVLWVDESYRTAVIGMPSGAKGWILDRDRQIPADRLAAARAVLRFNGYDLGRLEMTPGEGA